MKEGAPQDFFSASESVPEKPRRAGKAVAVGLASMLAGAGVSEKGYASSTYEAIPTHTYTVPELSLEQTHVFAENVQNIKSLLSLYGYVSPLAEIAVESASLAKEPEYEARLYALYGEKVAEILADLQAEAISLTEQVSSSRGIARKEALRGIKNLQTRWDAIVVAGRRAGLPVEDRPIIDNEKIERELSEMDVRVREALGKAYWYLTDQSALSEETVSRLSADFLDIEGDYRLLRGTLVDQEEFMMEAVRGADDRLKMTNSPDYQNILLERGTTCLEALHTLQSLKDELDVAYGEDRIDIPVENPLPSFAPIEPETFKESEARFIARLQTVLPLARATFAEMDSATSTLPSGEELPPAYLIVDAETLLSEAERVHALLEKELEVSMLEIEEKTATKYIAYDRSDIQEELALVVKRLADIDQLSQKTIGPLARVFGMTEVKLGLSPELLERYIRLKKNLEVAI